MQGTQGHICVDDRCTIFRKIQVDSSNTGEALARSGSKVNGGRAVNADWNRRKPVGETASPSARYTPFHETDTTTLLHSGLTVVPKRKALKCRRRLSRLYTVVRKDDLLGALEQKVEKSEIGPQILLQGRNALTAKR